MYDGSTEEYWTCDNCNKLFSDANGNTEIPTAPPIAMLGHRWAIAWEKNATHHWHNCANTGCPVTDNTQKDGYAAHSGGTASCTAQAVCATCGQSYGELVSHDFIGAYLSDADYHWHKCENCEATDNKTSHIYDDGQDTTCNTCGHTRTVTPPTPSHTHAWAGEWMTNDTHHWHECTAAGCDVTADSGKDGYAAHTPGEWIIDREATSSTPGQQHKECTVCGYTTQTEAIPATGGGSSGGYIPPIPPAPSTPPTYPPAVERPGVGGGAAEVSPSNPERGDTVTVTPQAGRGLRGGEHHRHRQGRRERGGHGEAGRHLHLYPARRPGDHRNCVRPRPHGRAAREQSLCRRVRGRLVL